jgi:hypothetical protein
MIGGTIDGKGTFVESLLSLPRHRRDESLLRDSAMLALAAVGLDGSPLCAPTGCSTASSLHGDRPRA